MCNKSYGPKLQNTLHVCFFCISVNIIIRFSGNEFSQYCSGHHSVKCHLGKGLFVELWVRNLKYLESCLIDFKFCLSVKYVMFNG